LRRLGTMFASRCFATLLAPFAANAEWRTGWSYHGTDGPEKWGHLDPEYAVCALGKEQSPIDIRTTLKAHLPVLQFVNRDGPLNIIHNGYTAVRVNYAPENGNRLTVGDRQYEMTQFHFHQPSEEYIHGRPHEMGLHLMYQASDGMIAAVAVFLKAGKANPIVEQLWKHMPRAKCDERRIAGVEINPSGLLPLDTGYYTYMGSLTAPPCTEGVTWFVLKNPVEISRKQIEAFASVCPNNVRPVQPLNGRVVKESR
jgi:carbonic anhydrase